MTQGLLWLPLLLVFVLLTALGWLERRRQRLFREWAAGAELAKLDSCGAARLVDGVLSWSNFEAGPAASWRASFVIKQLELVELLALGSGEAPLTEEAQGSLPSAAGGQWTSRRTYPSPTLKGHAAGSDELMSRSRCDL
jgi:hypothetical protein